MNHKPKFIITLLLGAAAGVAAGYYLASDNKEEIIEDLKATAVKIKDDVRGEINKGKEIVDFVRNTINDLLNRG
ncbi:MAG: YtxH domain-containing protein [Chitinophagales bacterium]|jgi:hypothetical protein|nr:YtxH domain-containing protein [Chitinophagales bacterium]